MIMAYSRKSYVEHVAIRVKDIDWHIRFFNDVLGMTVHEVMGSDGATEKAWTLGGMQFIAKPDFTGPEGRLAHLGIMCEDVEAAIAAAHAFGVTEMPQGRNWLRRPRASTMKYAHTGAWLAGSISIAADAGEEKSWPSN